MSDLTQVLQLQGFRGLFSHFIHKVIHKICGKLSAPDKLL